MTKLGVGHGPASGKSKSPTIFQKRPRAAKPRQCCYWSLIDTFLMFGVALGICAFAATTHYVIKPWSVEFSHELVPATCNVEKVARGGLAKSENDYPEEPDSRADDRPFPPPPHPGRRGPDREHGDRPERRDRRSAGSMQPLEGFDYPDEDGNMKCKNCYFFSKSRCRKGENGYFYRQMCVYSNFPCVQVYVSYSGKEGSEEDSEEEEWDEEDSNDHHNRGNEGDWEDHPRHRRVARRDHVHKKEEREGKEDSHDRSDLKNDFSSGFGMLYPNFEQMEIFPQCSYSACNQNSEENAQTVNDWVAGYEDKQKTGEQFDCYYDPQQPEQVFAGKVFSDSEVIHAAVWPSLVALVCILALIGRRAYFSCCKKSNGIMAREAPYAVSTPEETKSKIQDPEKDPAQLGPEVVAEANAPPLELKVAPQYKEMVAPPTYSQSNLHEAAKDSLPDCEA